MARPKKNNAEYFTHDADMRNDVKIKALRRKFQHTGYAVWNFMLESLTDSDYFEIERNAINLELLAADYDVSVETLNEIIDYCLKIGLLKEEDNRLFSEAHKQRFAPLLANRKRKWVINGNNADGTRGNDVSACRNTGKTGENDVSAAENHIVKESKVKESKEKKEISSNEDIKKKSIRFIPPTVEQVAEYCASRNNGIDATSFVDFYESRGWMIGKNKMKNWQAAVRTWENKRKEDYIKDKGAFPVAR